MFLCKVIGNVVSQQKEDCLVGKKMLLCERLDGNDHEKIVAVDMVGAGAGSQVLVARRYGAARKEDLIDDWIVGIVDAVSERDN